MNLPQIKTQLQATQAAFLDILAQADDATLYGRNGDEWTLAETLVHIAEARTFYAEEIGRLHANPGITIGRGLTHAGRTQQIIDHGRDSSADIEAQLTTSHNRVNATLAKMQDSDLSTIIGGHETWGDHTLGEFIGRYFVAHDQLHVQQAQAHL